MLPLPPATDPEPAPHDNAVRIPLRDDRDLTLLFRAESEMSAEERAKLTRARRGPSVLHPIEAKTRQSGERANALGTIPDEFSTPPSPLTREDRGIETASHNAERWAKTIGNRLNALTAFAKQVWRESTDRLRRFVLSFGTRAPGAVGQRWSAIGVFGVVALASFLVTRPGEDAAQAGSNPEIAQATLRSDVVLPAAIPSIVAPTTGRVTTPTARPAVKAQPQTVRVQTPGFIGTLAVQSDPPGAAVFVDRQRVGATPIQVPRLRAGSHVIWIEREGYQRWTASVLVPAEKLTRVTAKLVLESDR